MIPLRKEKTFSLIYWRVIQRRKFDYTISKKHGTKAYMFKAYLGIDPVTEKKKYTTKRGFKSQ